MRPYYSPRTRAAEATGYQYESLAAAAIVRIVERYVAQYRALFADSELATVLWTCSVGVDHALGGGVLARRWGLPLFVAVGCQPHDGSLTA